jgi:hypothetical protein
MTKPVATAPATKSEGRRRAKSSVPARRSASSRWRTVSENRSICAAA